MTKTTLCVLSCSIFILIVFVVFCYLMSTVDPEPYETNYTSGRKMDDLPSDDLYANDELSASDNVLFGLEKVPEDYEATTPYEAEVKWDTNFRKSIAVQIPVVAPSISKENATECTICFRTKKNNKQKAITLMFFPIQDYRDYRRSVNKLDKGGRIKKGVNKSKDVVFKIVDNSGEARMEVIIDSNDLFDVKGLNNSVKQLNDTNKQYEIWSNNTLIYNIGEESFKIVDDSKPIRNISSNSSNDIKYFKNDFTEMKNFSNVQNHVKTSTFRPNNVRANSERYKFNLLCKNSTFQNKTSVNKLGFTINSEQGCKS